MPRLAVLGERVAAEPPPGARRIELGGACVVPGLNDAHVHFPTWALAQRQVRLEGARSRAEAVGTVAEAL
ncbi:MAG: amidohydrolase, partial [Thermoleophilaceae bacterium]